jgi:hypothetical protein
VLVAGMRRRCCCHCCCRPHWAELQLRDTEVKLRTRTSACCCGREWHVRSTLHQFYCPVQSKTCCCSALFRHSSAPREAR